MFGRAYEKDILKKAIDSDKAELGIVYGRRRVGKSTLLRHFKKPKDFFFEGIQGENSAYQIRHFAEQLAEQTQTVPVAAQSWKDVFHTLTPYLTKGKRYVILDELPWMACEKTELIALLKYYWDNFWQKNPKLTLVLCGSIAQFMVKHVVHSKALHNRKTFEIKLEALPAHEAKLFFKKKRSEFEMIQALMVFGGIPKYLEQFDPNASLHQNIDALCFRKNGFFTTEFETLFKEQFKVTKTYAAIVEALQNHSLTVPDISHKIGMASGGSLTSYLENLERADFIKRFASFKFQATSGSKTIKYTLWDEWLRFYFRYMKPYRMRIETQTSPGLFSKLVQPYLAGYWGLSFEIFCQKNLPRLIEYLGIEDAFQFGPYFKQPPRGSGKPGVQVDCLIERPNRLYTLIECKYTQSPIGLSVAQAIQAKVQALPLPKHSHVETVLITASGATQDLKKSQLIDRIIGLEAFL